MYGFALTFCSVCPPLNLAPNTIHNRYRLHVQYPFFSNTESGVSVRASLSSYAYSPPRPHPVPPPPPPPHQVMEKRSARVSYAMAPARRMASKARVMTMADTARSAPPVRGGLLGAIRSGVALKKTAAPVPEVGWHLPAHCKLCVVKMHGVSSWIQSTAENAWGTKFTSR